MTTQQRAVQLAVMCLQELDAHAGKALSFSEISARRGISLPECTHVIQRLSDAGIVELAAIDQVILRRSIEDLTALDILQAVWSQKKNVPTFQMMVGPSHASVTLAFINRQRDAAING